LLSLLLKAIPVLLLIISNKELIGLLIGPVGLSPLVDNQLEIVPDTKWLEVSVNWVKMITLMVPSMTSQDINSSTLK